MAINDKEKKDANVYQLLKYLKERDPSFNLSEDLVSINSLYYPIAILEFSMKEKSFENFEYIQKTVLKLISVGVKDPKEIAHILGLSVNYIVKMIKLLIGYNHISEVTFELTELGKESLVTGKKIEVKEVKQKFQINALSGELIKKSNAVAYDKLKSKNDTLKGYTILVDYLEKINLDTLKQVIKSKDYTQYISNKNTILNTNVVSIDDIKLDEVKYTKTFLIKYRKHGKFNNYIYYLNLNENAKDFKGRFNWKEFFHYISDDKDNILYLNNTNGYEFIGNINHLLANHFQSCGIEQIEANVNNSRLFNINNAKLTKIPMSKNFYKYNVEIAQENIVEYNKATSNFILDLYENGYRIYSDDKLYGITLVVTTKDSLILEIGRKLHDLIQDYGSKEIFSEMNKHFDKYKSNQLLSEMNLFLDKYHDMKSNRIN